MRDFAEKTHAVDASNGEKLVALLELCLDFSKEKWGEDDLSVRREMVDKYKVAIQEDVDKATKVVPEDLYAVKNIMLYAALADQLESLLKPAMGMVALLHEVLGGKDKKKVSKDPEDVAELIEELVSKIARESGVDVKVVNLNDMRRRQGSMSMAEYAEELMKK